MPAIADLTLSSTEVFEPVRANTWNHYGTSSALNKSIEVVLSKTPAGTQSVTLKQVSPLERTVESVAVAQGFNSVNCKFNFNSDASTTERQAEIQETIDFLTAYKADLAAGKSFY